MAFTHLPSHLAGVQFPNTEEGLAAYDVIILSDIGANTLLLHPDTWIHGRPTPNRLRLLREWVARGGGLIMCGGYYSFAGIYGAARYHRTPIEEVLPVDISPYDDRVEAPEGVVPLPVGTEHPILAGVRGPWPALLGYNEVALKPDAGHGRLASPGDSYELVGQSAIDWCCQTRTAEMPKPVHDAPALLQLIGA